MTPETYTIGVTQAQIDFLQVLLRAAKDNAVAKVGPARTAQIKEMVEILQNAPYSNRKRPRVLKVQFGPTVRCKPPLERRKLPSCPQLIERLEKLQVGEAFTVAELLESTIRQVSLNVANKKGWRISVRALGLHTYGCFRTK